MAGIAVPDNLRPALAAIVKYHFWILAALVPLILVPLVLVGGADLRSRIAAQRKQIESKVNQARAVTAAQPHPNENWRTAIDADTDAVKRETVDEWRRFWHGQRNFRVWPAELGDAFLADVAKLRPGGKLDRQSLVRYQNMAPRLVRALPRRMGVDDAMAEQREGQAPAATALPPPLAWNAASQKRLHDSFVWTRVPTTTQVLVAQEELWVYGLFCDLLSGFVKGATGAHDSALTWVDDIVIGFQANQQSAPATRRVVMPKGSPQGVPDGLEPQSGTPGATQAPWNPRYTGGQVEARVDPATGEQPAVSAEDAYRGWMYVDFAGKPLSAPELAAAPDMQMVHLVPFVLRVVVDQRQIDRLLTTLAGSSIPIDVRQVRIDAVGAGGGSGGRRPNDVVVELHGSVALATPPTVAAVAGEAAP